MNEIRREKMTQRIHISLQVSDLQRAVGFYESLFGQPVSKRRQGYANFRLEEPPIHLSLIGGSSEVTAYPGHHGVELANLDDLADWRQRLEDAGLPTRLEDDVTCCYARADKVWVEDPDGNDWEVWVRKADADVMKEPEDTSSCCSTGCCG